MSKKLSTAEKARRAWVRALRSGKYKWGKEALQPKEGRFCCLGVLCEVAIKAGVLSSYNFSNGCVPLVVKEWAGLNGTSGEFRNNSLAGINDQSTRNPFLRIANLIEKKPQGLFAEEGE